MFEDFTKTKPSSKMFENLNIDNIIDVNVLKLYNDINSKMVDKINFDSSDENKYKFYDKQLNDDISNRVYRLELQILKNEEEATKLHEKNMKRMGEDKLRNFMKVNNEKFINKLWRLLKANKIKSYT